MAEAADRGLIARLTNAVDEFRQYYDRLADVRYGAAIARLHDNQLMHDYGKELIAAEKIKDRIEAVTGAWHNIRQWAGLGAIPLIPIVVISGLLSVIGGASYTIVRFMRRADIALAMREDPELSYEQAAGQVQRAHQGIFGRTLDVAQLGLWILGAFLVYRIVARA